MSDGDSVLMRVRRDIMMATRPRSMPKAWKIPADDFSLLVGEIYHFQKDKGEPVFFEVGGVLALRTTEEELPPPPEAFPNIMVGGVPVWPYEKGVP